MRNIYAYLTGLAMASACCLSCVNLDTLNPSSVSSTLMWSNETYAKAGVDAILTVWKPYGRDIDVFGDYPNLKMIGRNRIESFGFTSETVYSPYFSRAEHNADNAAFRIEWQQCYEGVAMANDAIANLHKAMMSAAKLDRYMCEAKFYRALYYYRLNALFQGVPLYLEPVDNENCTKGRSSADDVWNQCIADLTDCIESANLPDNTLSSTYGRPSRGAAYSLRGMVYMWKKEWAKASADFEQVASCGYGLWEGRYIDFFTEANEKDHEMILPLQFSRSQGYGDYSQGWFGTRSTSSAQSRIQPATRFVDSFLNEDGSEFNWEDIFPDWNILEPDQREVFFLRDSLLSEHSYYSNEWKIAKSGAVGRISQSIFDKYYLNTGNEARLKQAYEHRDPRLSQIIIVPYEPVMTCAGVGFRSSLKTHRWPFIYPGNGESEGDLWPEDRVNFRYAYRKFVTLDDQSLYPGMTGLDWPLIRYTDVLLLYAEAQNELDNLDEAVLCVNRIRRRAGLALLNDGQAHNAVSGKEDMRERIRYERRVELCGEGVNFFDEVRWDTFKDTKFAGQDEFSLLGPWGKSLMNYYWMGGAYPWPVPSKEIQKNPNLEPTPGWNY